MLIASKGVGTSLSAISHTGRQAQSHFASGTRAIHIPPSAASVGASLGAGAAARPTPGTASRVLHEARTALTKFFGHLRTPGFTHSVAGTGRYASSAATSRAFGVATRQPTIHAQFSPHVRHALSGSRGSFMPRARPPIRSTMDVGIGVARNFSSSRPLFQTVVENVPIAGRTVCEADLDLKKRNRAAGKRFEKKQGGKENIKTKEMLKENKKAKKDATLELYFPQAQAESIVEGIKTVLLIPLAPTPSSRFPLSQRSGEPKFLPLASLGDLHASHRLHSSRVSSLFARLDTAGVWERGVACAAYGDRSGLCTVLRVEFVGWTEEMVRGVIGEAGKEWCQVVEMKDEDGWELESVSGMSSLSNFSSSDASHLNDRASPTFDPSTSFVLPTLDFSSAFLRRDSDTSRTPSIVSSSFPPSPALSGVDMASHSPISDLSLDLEDATEVGSDVGSDEGSDRFSDFSVPSTVSDVSWSEVMSIPDGPLSVSSVSASSSVMGGMSFSSEFISRASEPMETAFY